ncbi:MAG TPA: nucleotide sugar dehydrogenase [Candidatus Saccharimonadales bacterium]|nr:nucleotide sugar dehydrogenase [Candidatus Saccharimonadales bacterium]
MKVCVVGSGFVGQATGKGLAKHGHEVSFLDIDTRKLEQLRSDGFKADHPKDVERIESHITTLTVPTPSHQEAIDLGPLKRAVEQLGQRLRHHRDYHLVVVRSTVTPGTTHELVIPILEELSDKQAGRDFGVCMQPEFLRQATAQADFDRPWHILIGQLDARSGDLLADVYQPFNAPIERASIHEAEMQKYVHNLYNAAKIAFFNEMRLVCQREGWNDERIFGAVAQSCEGIWNPLYGLGDKGPFDGACLPKDTEAFLHWGKGRSHDLRVLEAVIEQNRALARLRAAAQRELEASPDEKQYERAVAQLS